MPERPPVSLVAMDVEPRTATIYPAVFAPIVAGRAKRVLGDRFGLDQFGVNLTTLAPGASSSVRHYHMKEDEFVYVIDGEIELEDEHWPPCSDRRNVRGVQGRREERPPACQPVVEARHLPRNRHALAEEDVTYPDVDMKAVKVTGKFHVTRKDGSAF